ncbi:MAG: hypothetical protein K6A41_01275 [Bacteroidales bacterium]|nr:hypothetical protein [Bacteroidales bacterium]
MDTDVIGKVRETQVSCWTPLQMRMLTTPWRLFSSPNIQKFELDKNAQLTDSLYCFGLSSYNNFLLSPKFKDLVDYQKSTFYSTEWLNNNTRKPITLQNFEEYKYLMSLDKEAKMGYHLGVEFEIAANFL